MMFFSVGLAGLENRPFARVVRGERKMPVAVHVVDALKVVEGGFRRRDDVAALVDPVVLAQVEIAPGRRDELPKPGGLGGGVSHRVEAAFHQGQQGDFGRQASCFALVDDVIEVAIAAPEQA